MEKRARGDCWDIAVAITDHPLGCGSDTVSVPELELGPAPDSIRASALMVLTCISRAAI